MKIQMCNFERAHDPGKRERGIAWLRSGFDTYDVLFILDEEGEHVPNNTIRDYTLIDGPQTRIDTQSDWDLREVTGGSIVHS